MLKHIFTYIVASAVAFTVACLPLATPIAAKSCDDIKFIFARGSGQSLGDNEYQTFKSSLEVELKNLTPSLKASIYELGTNTYGGAKYPAIAPDLIESLGAKISAGKNFAFGESVKAGETELKSYIDEVSSLCKNTKFVLSGYSQGAMIMSDSIPDLDPEKVIYVATFGDPYLYLPEGFGLFPEACRGENLSDYREFAPNCRTASGVLGSKIPYEPENWWGKVGLWCNNQDFICGAGLKLSFGSVDEIINNALAAGHLNYVSDGHFDSAAKKIIEKIKEAFNVGMVKNRTAGNRDTVFLFDRTGSMAPYIDKYKQEASKLAKETIQLGGRVSLYIYGDLDDPIPAVERITDFGMSLSDFNDGLNNIVASEGGDEKESLLHALLTVMNEQNWRAGATKSIVVLTDSGFLSPDRDGTTLEQVVKRSLEIDPVNVYVIDSDNNLETRYSKLVNLTNGQIFDSSTSYLSATNYLLERPAVNFPLAKYEGIIGSNMTFSVDATGEIVSYEWDTDFDGVFDSVTTTPTISKTYSAKSSGYLQVKVTDSSGKFSTASVPVAIVDHLETSPSLNNISMDESTNSARVNYQLGENTSFVLVSVNGNPLGITTEQNLEITDLDNPSTITLTPISRSGMSGQAVSLNFDNSTPSSKTTSRSTTTDGSASNDSTTNKTTSNGSTTNSITANSVITSNTTTENIKILAPNSGKR